MRNKPTHLGEVMCKEKRELELVWSFGVASWLCCPVTLCFSPWISFGQMHLPVPQFSGAAVDSKSL